MRIVLDTNVLVSAALKRSSMAGMAVDMVERRGGLLESEEKTGQRRWEAELHRLEGIALVGLNRLDEGQRALEEALRVARADSRRSPMSCAPPQALPGCWGERGRRAEARELLACIYGWFTEGFDTADLKRAQALLGQLP